jgi:AraC family transcriptional regulator
MKATTQVRPSTAVSYRERIARAVVAIESDPALNPSLDTLAGHACLSPFHFHRVFRAIVGENPAEYSRRLRLERAAHELLTTDRTVSAIGVEAGYPSGTSFTRAFSARFAAPPAMFRRRQRTRVAPASSRRDDLTGRIERLAPLRVGFIRHVGPYEDVPPTFARLAAWAATGRPRAQAGNGLLFLGMAHDNPGVTPADKLRFDCCVELTHAARPANDIAIRELPGGMYATALHRGSFDGLAATYAWLAREFVPREGRTIRKAPALEMYLTQPDRTPPADQLTEVMIPVR